jgi:predicted nuclease of restriction endonuclease-like (RecB) superfamily
VRTELSWTHYRILSRIEDEMLRVQYTNTAIEEGWDTRALQRNIKTQYLGRTLASDKTKNYAPHSLLKDPYIFEFLGLPSNTGISENDLETALTNHLQQFLMELGKGFAFVARQQHLVTDRADFYIDLVFYNYYLKCFVLIDLKIDKLSHADIGQMDMYVRMYNDLKKGADLLMDLQRFIITMAIRTQLSVIARFILILQGATILRLGFTLLLLAKPVHIILLLDTTQMLPGIGLILLLLAMAPQLINPIRFVSETLLSLLLKDRLILLFPLTPGSSLMYMKPYRDWISSGNSAQLPISSIRKSSSNFS